MKVNFYDFINNPISDEKLKFAVIIAETRGKMVFCKHQKRDTYECPGGHREPGEMIMQTARRELYEETGALDFDIAPVCVYSVVDDGKNGEETETFGMLCFADIRTFEEELHNEIEKIIITEELPEQWTYPQIQPKLVEYVAKKRLEKEVL